VKTAEKNNLMDDLAWSIYEYLLEESTLFQDKNLVLLPITVIAKKFDRNHRTVSRRLSALKSEGLIKTIIKKDYVALYSITKEEDYS
jgi:DNA-binding Lrp family transcriptional regulator|tara:strand:- start:7 stop:267 length:261 start_codon:yes stop_codon:yes gene_type:complete